MDKLQQFSLHKFWKK